MHRRNKISFLTFRSVKRHLLFSILIYTTTGAIRTATKRAGGTVHNHGGSPGKRLGVKKFSGWLSTYPSFTTSNRLPLSRSVRHPWKHHCQTARYSLPPGTTCMFSVDLIGTSFYILRYQVKMGRDHTIYATVPGFVRFYKEKWMRGERRFVGVVLHRGEVLPRDEVALGTSRYCGLAYRNSSV